jgi:hypothetical protein
MSSKLPLETSGDSGGTGMRREREMERAVRDEIVRFVLASPENRHSPLELRCQWGFDIFRIIVA